MENKFLYGNLKILKVFKNSKVMIIYIDNIDMKDFFLIMILEVKYKINLLVGIFFFFRKIIFKCIIVY